MSEVILRKLRQRIDDRPLFQYKISEEEYRILRTTLKNGDKDNLYWKVYFALFAAEAFRRTYAGGHWTQDLIFKEISDRFRLSQPQFEKTIAGGLKYLKRPLFRNNAGRQFLGTIARESGIPRDAFIENGYLVNTLREAFNGYTNFHTGNLIRDIQNLALKHNTPEVLQSDVYYQILNDIIERAFELKHQFQLGKHADPIAYLDQVQPEWRVELPIFFDGEKGVNFLNILISDVVQAPSLNDLKIQLSTYYNEENDLFINKLIFPDGHYTKEDLRVDSALFDKVINAKILLSSIESSIEIEVGSTYKSLKNGKEGFNIQRLGNSNLPSGAHLKKWELRFVDRFTEASFNLPIISETLWEELPWFFIKDQNNHWVYKGQGSVRTHRTEGLLIANPTLAIQQSDITNFVVVNKEKHKVIHINQTIELKDEENRYRIALAQNKDDRPFLYYLSPAKTVYDNYFSLNAKTFLGVPYLVKQDKITLQKQRIQISNIEYFYAGEWHSNCHLGKVHIRYVEDGITVFLQRNVQILPENFSYNLENNKIYLQSFDPFIPEVQRHEAVEWSNLDKGEDGALSVSFDKDFLKRKETIQFRLRNKEAEELDNLYFKLPVPSQSLKLLYNDKVVHASELNVHQLDGYRLFFNNLSSTSITKTISIRSTDDAQVCYTKKVTFPAQQVTLLPLLECYDLLLKAIAFGNNIHSAMAELTITGEKIRIRVYPHSGEHIEYNQEERSLSTQCNSEQVMLQALCLSSALSKKAFLEIPYNITTQDWNLEILDNKKPWLIFPDKTSKIQFKPFLVKAKEEVSLLTEEETHLGSFSSIRKRKDRIAAYQKLFDTVALDEDHTVWDEMELLYKRTKHLPFTTFDVWKAMASHPKMIIASIEIMPPQFLERLHNEFIINWYKFPVQDWIEMLSAFTNGLKEKDRSLFLESIFDQLEHRLHQNTLSKILKHKFLEEFYCDELSFGECQTNIMGYFVQLLQRTENVKYWTRNHDIVAFYNKNIPDSLKELFSNYLPIEDYHKSVVFLPVTLAYLSIFPQDDFSVEDFRLLKIIDFDRDWFQLIFNMVQHYIYSQKTQLQTQ